MYDTAFAAGSGVDPGAEQDGWSAQPARSQSGVGPCGAELRNLGILRAVNDVTIGSYLHRDEAEIAAARLRAGGIIGRVVADDEGGLNPGFFAEYRVRVVVRPTDEAEATAILSGEEGILAAEEDRRVIELPRQIHEALLAHSRFSAPNEACGLLAVDAGAAIRMAYCLTNVKASPTRFTIAPSEHLGALRHAERNGWSIGGSFHSHPTAEPYPSRRDIAGALDPEWVHFIAGPAQRSVVRAFRIVDSRVTELPIKLVAGPVRSAP